ncbi:MAG: hypothetical protein IT375_30265 [Polyangiaceae bacterium]|nr:hypothetical protein [Polyangiaceae bacterium]
MSRRWLPAALLLFGCGGEVDRAPGNGSAPCTGPHWRRVLAPPGAGDRALHQAAAWGPDQIEVWGGLRYDDPQAGALRPLVSGWHVSSGGEVLPIPTAGAPSPRGSEALGILGNRMLVWGGGEQNGDLFGDGAQLDLTTDTWSPMAAPAQLAPRHSAVAGRAGSALLIWGGYGGDTTGTWSGVFGDGALYEPTAGVWKKLGGDPLELEAWSYHTAVAQAGEHVAVLTESAAGAQIYYFLPDEQRWFAASTAGGPSSRSGAVMVYLSAIQELLVWGGYGDNVSNDGARYSLLTDSWKPISTAGAPSARSQAYAAALGTPGLGARVVVWGGSPNDQFGSTNTGGIYDVATDTWTPLPPDECRPPALNSATFTAFGNGRQALLWGGSSDEDLTAPEEGWLFTLEP